MKRQALAEYIGTFALVFCGTGAITINEQWHGVIGNSGIAATFGLIVMAMIYSFGPASGAHFNPAVTIAFTFAGLFPKNKIPVYIIAQVSGALSSSFILKYLFPDNINLGNTIPSGSAMQSFFLELILSYFLMMVILNVSHGAKEIGVLAGIAIGATVGLEALFAGPVCGASMNPVRSLAPALVSGNLQHLWIYLTAPFAGMIAATITWRLMRQK